MIDAAEWIEKHLTHPDGEPVELEPWQRHVAEALRDGRPLRMLTPDELRLSERRAYKRSMAEALRFEADMQRVHEVATMPTANARALAARLRETR